MTTSAPASTPLSYASPERSTFIGIASVVIGTLGACINAFIAATLITQLMKQLGIIPHGATHEPISAWLVATSGEACISGLLNITLMALGIELLRGRHRARALHRVYARVKLPLAVWFAVCVGWGMPFFKITGAAAVVSGTCPAFILGAAYPLLLLRQIRLSGAD